ncbi:MULTISPECIES: hypothetical protein [unclassified Streptomyces]|uniref:hypothetical protein n=1 Tax=unclassified Streptomyces TaxID=2593676 RepID=UPI003318F16B
MTRVAVRRHMVLDFDPTTGKPAPVEYRRQLANHDCGAADGFVHPYFPKEAKRAHRPWPVADPYEEAGDLSAGVPTCTVPTRTRRRPGFRPGCPPAGAAEGREPGRNALWTRPGGIWDRSHTPPPPPFLRSTVPDGTSVQ